MNFKISDTATSMISQLMEKNGINPFSSLIRLGVQGGCCSSIAYTMTFNAIRNENDVIIICNNISFIFDNKAQMYLEGGSLDYSSQPGEEGFIFRTTSTCNCNCKHE